MNQGHSKLVATSGGFTFNPSFSIYLFSRPAFAHFFHICRRLCLYPNGINKSEGKGTSPSIWKYQIVKIFLLGGRLLSTSNSLCLIIYMKIT